MGSSSFSGSRLFRISPFTKPYALNREEIQDFKVFWNKHSLALSNVDPFLSLPLSRFQEALFRFNRQDAILDHAIALEAVLLGGISDELTFRFSIRGSTLIGDQPEKRLKLRQQFTNLYKERNHIVHGNRKKKKSIMKPEAAGHLARLVLTQCLELSQVGPAEKIPSRLEEYLVAQPDESTFEEYFIQSNEKKPRK